MEDEFLEINQHLFYETSHSPSLIDIVGHKRIKEVVDFCFIANPYYPTPKMLRQLQKNLPVVIKSYPSSNPRLSQERLSTVLHVDSKHIILGNGASELITIIEDELIEHIGIPVPTFSEYIEKLRNESMARLFPLSAEEHYNLDLDKYAAWIKENELTSILLINPGNPTGQFFPKEEIINFIEGLQHLDLIIVDESFIDFSGTPVPSILDQIEKYPNLLVVRSMSKHCGIPGLRLGYCCTSNEELKNQIRKNIPVWNINTLAEYFLGQLEATDAEYQKARKQVIVDVKNLYEAVRHIEGFTAYPSGSNFLLIHVDTGCTASELQMKLLKEHKVYVRDCSNKVGMDKYHIRVASQGKEKDQLIIKALRAVSNEFKQHAK